MLGSLSIPSPFKELDHNLFDSPVGDNRVVQLIKNIIKSYSKIKFYHLGKNANDNRLYSRSLLTLTLNE